MDAILPMLMEMQRTIGKIEATVNPLADLPQDVARLQGQVNQIAKEAGLTLNMDVAGDAAVSKEGNASVG